MDLIVFNMDACLLSRQQGWSSVDIEGDATKVLSKVTNMNNFLERWWINSC
ncbi:hypothetical protein LINPERHAP1_LOCUS34141 [Linum perenne]